MSGDQTTVLDVEDDEQRQKRISTLLERLNGTSPSSSASPNTLLNIGRELPTGPVEPPAALLARVRDFLPAIAASNKALSLQKPEDIDIEHVADDESQYIEMNLGLGVLEGRPHPNADSAIHSPSPSSDADSTSGTSSCSSSDSESYHSASEEGSDEYSSSDSDDNSGSDSDSDVRSGSSVDMKPIAPRPIKPLPRRVPQQAKLEV